MARIAGVDLPREKTIGIGLTAIYGIGEKLAKKILKKLDIDPGIRVKNLSEDQVSKIRDEISENHKVEGDLRSRVALDIRRLMDIKCYRGIRHSRGLPVRGQRTKTNARTCKGPKKTVGQKKK